ncbi:Crp/Fnr family transcriptional regulator [Nesterenkonia natronophila]|uniref:Crp/Fnr family transcriptional regulator n=1 Tax=Nesterenkonia natronophila TaxID=2174932 RepID=UPI001CEF57CB|nr:Crp/Fnr family transcriptional regulator [Nesterenkonia natronophila]
MTAQDSEFTCLSEVDLFADLSSEEKDSLHERVPERRFRRGELVFSQEEPVSALFVLQEGRVRIFRVAEDGKAFTLAILEPGAVFGEMLLVGQQMYDNYAEALEDSVVCQLSVSDVEQHLLTDPRIAVRIARLLGGQAARLEERLTDLALRPLAARVAKTLLTRNEPTTARSLGARLGQRPAIRITHEQLAGLLGATREATSKVLSEFAAQGLIRQVRGRITLLDHQRLNAIARTTA